MTKFLTLAIALSLVGQPVYAQQNKMNIGVVGGPSMIFLRGNDIINEYHQPTVGFSGGISMQYNFQKIFSIHTDVQFERKGSGLPLMFSDIGNAPEAEKNVHVNFNYLSAPLLLRATFGKKAGFFVNAGPFLGYLFKQTVVYPAGIIHTNEKYIVDNTENMKRLDFGASAGLGLSIPINDKFLFSFEIRENLGFYNTSAVSVIHDGTIKTSSTNLLICFAYRLGTRVEEAK